MDRRIAGRYSLEREIGRGGTGVVWLGRDDVLGRPVALKRIGLLPGADHTDVARAEREARLSARILHPNVVAVYDVVADRETDEHWLVMEHVDGITLAQLVRDRGRLPPDQAAPLLRQAADGLAAAHAGGITHRDVKPSNILVCADGQVKLSDFGIARFSADATITQTGVMTGTPSYLAPEVAAGGRGEPPADVWSLGATTFHVLAGRPPYEVGEQVLATLYRIIEDDPPQLPDAGSLAPLLAGTMVKDPERRWTMEQVRDFLSSSDLPRPPAIAAVGPVDDGHTRVLGAVAAPPVPPAQPRAGALRRSRGLVAGLAAAAALLLAVVLYAALSGGGTGHPPASSGSPTGSAKPAAAHPTAEGMESFIRDYVVTVAADPEEAWTMLTPKFQRESGGLEKYRSFWEGATDGQVLSITADPARLAVSYQVHFDNFDNGPGPTVLDLAYTNGHYLIDGERTQGFVPAD